MLFDTRTNYGKSKLETWYFIQDFFKFLELEELRELAKKYKGNILHTKNLEHPNIAHADDEGFFFYLYEIKDGKLHLEYMDANEVVHRYETKPFEYFKRSVAHE